MILKYWIWFPRSMILKIEDILIMNFFYLFACLFVCLFLSIYSFVGLALKTLISVLESYQGLDNHRSLVHENYIYVLAQTQKKGTLPTLNVLYKRWLRCGLQMSVVFLILHHPYVFTQILVYFIFKVLCFEKF